MLIARVYAPWRYAPVTVCSVEFELRPTRGVAALYADKIALLIEAKVLLDTSVRARRDARRQSDKHAAIVVIYADALCSSAGCLRAL